MEQLMNSNIWECCFERGKTERATYEGIKKRQLMGRLRKIWNGRQLFKDVKIKLYYTVIEQKNEF